MHFEYATRASKGARSYQEDAVALLGVTGDGPRPLKATHACLCLRRACRWHGRSCRRARASALACAHFSTSSSRALLGERGDTLECLTAGLDGANAAIQAKSRSTLPLAGMGCTLVGAAFTTRGIEWVSVGDSLYFSSVATRSWSSTRTIRLRQRIDKLAAAGKISWEAALADPRRHFLRSGPHGGARSNSSTVPCALSRSRLMTS